MTMVGTGFSMSLDGFIAGPNDDVQKLFAWMSQGDTDYNATIGDEAVPLKVSSKGVEFFENAIQTTGALIAGRHLFDITGGWGGRHPLNVPVFVVTHNPPQDWINKDTPFTFVSDGVESAIAQAKKVAGDKSIAIASTTILQQAINAGLVDEIHIDLVPVVLGNGTRLFDNLDKSLELKITNVVEDIGVTHLTYRVIK